MGINSTGHLWEMVETCHQSLSPKRGSWNICSSNSLIYLLRATLRAINSQRNPFWTAPGMGVEGGERKGFRQRVSGARSHEPLTQKDWCRWEQWVLWGSGHSVDSIPTILDKDKSDFWLCCYMLYDFGQIRIPSKLIHFIWLLLSLLRLHVNILAKIHRKWSVPHIASH